MKRIIVILLAMSLHFSSIAQVAIDPSLQLEMKKCGPEDKIKIGILMKEQSKPADLLAVTNNFSTNAERRSYVVERLQGLAKATQADLLETLEEMQHNGMVDDIRPVWMINGISCRASQTAILSLAQRPDIKTLYHCEPGFLPPTVDASVEQSELSKGIAENVLIVNADKVWELGYTGQGVLVGHLDTGANYNHLDLQGRMWDADENYPHYGYDVYEHDDDPMDTWGHGTHVIGTICGTGAAGTQTGVAPGCKVMEVKVFSDEVDVETDEFILADGIGFAIEHGAQVLNMSLGKSGDDPVFRLAMRQCCDNALAAGVVIVTTSGNLRSFQSFVPIPYNIGCPGSIPSPWMHPDQAVNAGGISSIICVGSTENNDHISNFSSPGPGTWADIPEYADYPYAPGDTTQIGIIKPDICAPGGNVVSLGFPGNDTYKADLGTSFAAPCVTGTIALMLSKNPNLTPAQIDEIIETTAVKLSEHKSNDYGSGRIDALAAVEAVEAITHTPETNEPQAQVFPNPSNSSFTVKCDGMSQLEVFSVDGRLVSTETVNQPYHQIDGLKNGIYVLRITKGEEKIIQRIVKY